jgi:hypothetical protein
MKSEERMGEARYFCPRSRTLGPSSDSWITLVMRRVQ